MKIINKKISINLGINFYTHLNLNLLKKFKFKLLYLFNKFCINCINCINFLRGPLFSNTINITKANMAIALTLYLTIIAPLTLGFWYEIIDITLLENYGTQITDYSIKTFFAWLRNMAPIKELSLLKHNANITNEQLTVLYQYPFLTNHKFNVAQDFSLYDYFITPEAYPPFNNIHKLNTLISKYPHAINYNNILTPTVLSSLDTELHNISHINTNLILREQFVITYAPFFEHCFDNVITFRDSLEIVKSAKDNTTLLELFKRAHISVERYSATLNALTRLSLEEHTNVNYTLDDLNRLLGLANYKPSELPIPIGFRIVSLIIISFIVYRIVEYLNFF